MKKQIYYASMLLFLLGNVWLEASAQTPTNNPQAKSVLLPNGWSLSPAGRSLPLGDLPLNIQLSPFGKLLAVTNNGHGQQKIQLIDPQTEQLLDEKLIRKSWYRSKFSAIIKNYSTMPLRCPYSSVFHLRLILPVIRREPRR